MYYLVARNQLLPTGIRYLMLFTCFALPTQKVTWSKCRKRPLSGCKI